MSGFLLGGILAAGAFCVIEGILLFGRAQILLNQAEEILARLEPPLLTADLPRTPVELIAGTDADTDELPVIERPRPMPGPRTVPEAEAIGRMGDDELAEWRAQLDSDLAAWRAGLEQR